METSNDILNELTSVSPFIAGLQKVQVFTVPEGYFNNLGTSVLANLQREQLTAVPVGSPTLDVPPGYFDNLAGTILQRIKEEENPGGEFETLSPLLLSLRNKQPFDLPENYFDKIGSSILSRVASSAGLGIQQLSPILQGIQHKQVFEVPAGYFSTLASDILKKVLPQTSRVVVMHRRSTFIKYAVAAMMTGVVALGLYKYIDRPDEGPSFDNNNGIAALDAAIKKGTSMNEQQFTESLAKLSGADIAAYLEKNGDITDVAALGNNLEATGLPSEEDYLLDEFALDKFLDEIEKSALNN